MNVIHKNFISMQKIVTNKWISSGCLLFIVVMLVMPYVSVRKLKRSSKNNTCDVSDELSIAVGQCGAIGRRPTMEDSTLVEL